MRVQYKLQIKILRNPALLILVSVHLIMGCADTLQFAPADSRANGTKTLAGGGYEVDIDATSNTDWSYYDFENKGQAVVSDPMINSIWDIGFQRFAIKTNGGASGNAGGEVVAVLAGDFAATTQAPDFSAAKVDVADAGSGGDCNTTGGVLYAFLDDKNSPNVCWFSYDQATHKLSPRDVLYFVKTAALKYYKIHFINYYSSTGTPAVIRFQWAEVAAP